MKAKEKVYIVIADFQFELIFFPHRQEIIDSFQKQLQFLGGYICDKSSRISDCKIEIHYERQKLELSKKKEIIYAPIAENVRDNIIKTSYNISIPQLIILLHSLLLHCISKSNDVIIIHASGVQDRLGAYLFLGKNESGKSTTAKLVADGKRIFPFCDDMCILRNKGTSIICYPAAIFEGRPNSFLNNSGIPLVGIYSIFKSDWFQITKLDPTENISYIRRLIKEQTRFMFPNVKIKTVKKFTERCREMVYLLFLQNKQLTNNQRRQLIQS